MWTMVLAMMTGLVIVVIAGAVTLTWQPVTGLAGGREARRSR